MNTGAESKPLSKYICMNEKEAHLLSEHNTVPKGKRTRSFNEDSHFLRQNMNEYKKVGTVNFYLHPTFSVKDDEIVSDFNTCISELSSATAFLQHSVFYEETFKYGKAQGKKPELPAALE